MGGVLDVKIGMCIYQTLYSDWLLCVTGSAGHAPALRLVMLHVPECRQFWKQFLIEATAPILHWQRTREGVSEGEGRASEREGERERFLPVRRVHICTMASDPGLLPLLVWTISMQVLGSRGTSNNEGKCVCVCVYHTDGDLCCLAFRCQGDANRETGASCHSVCISNYGTLKLI